MAVFGAEAQEPARNAVYGEILGNGIFPTANYERRFTDRFAGRVGLSVIFGSSGGDTDLTLAIPVMGIFISHPTTNHHFEAGGGVLLVAGDAQDFLFDSDEQIANGALTGVLGYRFQRPGRGFLFRAGATPIVSDGEVLPLIGLSFGYVW